MIAINLFLFFNIAGCTIGSKFSSGSSDGYEVFSDFDIWELDYAEASYLYLAEGYFAVGIGNLGSLMKDLAGSEISYEYFWGLPTITFTERDIGTYVSVERCILIPEET